LPNTVSDSQIGDYTVNRREKRLFGPRKNRISIYVQYSYLLIIRRRGLQKKKIEIDKNKTEKNTFKTNMIINIQYNQIPL
jgi:hypothetical protein